MKRNGLATILVLLLIFLVRIPVYAGELDDAANRGDVIRVKQLLEQGADVNAGDKLKYSPLHKAAEYGYTEIVKILIEHGANVSARTEDKQTPLHRAAGPHGKPEVATLLLDTGADINAQDWSKDTPLHVAAQYGNTDVAALLIQKGANVNALNENQETPLHRAAGGYNSVKVAELLIEKGADLNARDNNGDTPVMIAEKFKHLEVAAVLRKTDSSSARQDFDAKLQKVAKAGAVYQDDLEVIMRLAPSLKPPPVIPQEAQQEMIDGKAAFKLARRLEDYKKAEEYFRRASVLVPWLPEPYFNLAIAQEKQYKWDDAKYSLEKYLIAAPNAGDTPAVKQKMAEMELQKRRWEDFDQEVNIGVILYKKGPDEYNEAIRHWKRAVELCPEHYRIDQVYFNLGEAYMNQGNLDDAYKYMQKSLEVNPDTDIAARYTNLGVVLERRGDRTKACGYYKKGCNLSSKVSCGNYSNICP